MKSKPAAKKKYKKRRHPYVKKAKRILSLVLALIMICSAMGVMTFAAVGDPIDAHCTECKSQQTFLYSHYSDTLNRVVECPNHNGAHDAEERYLGHMYYCATNPEHWLFIRTDIVYICLD